VRKINAKIVGVQTTSNQLALAHAALKEQVNETYEVKQIKKKLNRLRERCKQAVLQTWWK